MSGDSADPISHAQFTPGGTALVLGCRGVLVIPAEALAIEQVSPFVLDGRPGFAVVVAQHLAGDQGRVPFAVVEFDADAAQGATVLVRGEVGLFAVVEDEALPLEGSTFATWREHRLTGLTAALLIGAPTATVYRATAPSVLPVASARIPLGAKSDTADAAQSAPSASQHNHPYGQGDPLPGQPDHRFDLATLSDAPQAPASPSPTPATKADRNTETEFVSDDDPPPVPPPSGAVAVSPSRQATPRAFGLLTTEPPPASGEEPESGPGGSRAATDPVPMPAEPTRTPYDFSGALASPFAASDSPPTGATHAEHVDTSQPHDPSPAREFQTTVVGSLRDQLVQELQRTPREEADDDLGRTIARPRGLGLSGPTEREALGLSGPTERDSPGDLPAMAAVRAKRCACGRLCDPLSSRCYSCGASLNDCPIVTGPPPVVGRLRFDDGQEVALLGPLTLGRKPPSSRKVSGVMATPIALADPEQRVSLFHLEVRVEEWTVSIVDYGSTNHTWATLPDQNPVRLRANQPFTIIPGTTVDLGGQRTFTYISGPA